MPSLAAEKEWEFARECSWQRRTNDTQQPMPEAVASSVEGLAAGRMQSYAIHGCLLPAIDTLLLPTFICLCTQRGGGGGGGGGGGSERQQRSSPMPPLALCCCVLTNWHARTFIGRWEIQVPPQRLSLDLWILWI